MTEMLNAECYDIIHFLNTMPIYKNNKKTKVVVTIHDLQEFVLNKYGGWGNIYRRFIVRSDVKLADKIITVSQNSKNDLLKFLKVSEEKIEVIYEGIDERVRIIVSEVLLLRFREKHGLSSTPFILSVGEINPAKNLVLLLEVFSCIKNKYKLKLLLVGKDGIGNHLIYKKAKELKLDSDVVFTGYLPVSELNVAYSSALFPVYPSLYEGFGFPPLESMACGCPVLASNISSIPEIVGDAALLFDPLNVNEIANTIKTILKDTDLRQTLRNRGLERVKQFSWEETAQKTLAVYKEVYENRH